MFFFFKKKEALISLNTKPSAKPSNKVTQFILLSHDDPQFRVSKVI